MSEISFDQTGAIKRPDVMLSHRGKPSLKYDGKLLKGFLGTYAFGPEGITGTWLTLSP